MKKFLIAFIIAVMLIGTLPMMAVTAVAATSGTSGDCVWSVEGTVLTISGNGAMDDYNVGDDGGFEVAPWGRGVTDVIIQNGVTYIGKFAFAWNECLENVTIAESVQNIGDFAFSGCNALETLVLHNNVPNIGKTGFSECKSIKELTFGKKVSSADTILAFGDVPKLEKITISADNPYFVFEDGIVFSKNKKELVLYLDSNTRSSYTIPNGVESIGRAAFARCKTITKVVIPNGVKTIGNEAFQYAKELTEINIPNSVETIGEKAFLDTTKISSITIPDSVTSLGREAFFYSGIKEITLGSGIQKIDELTFAMTPLENIVIPYGVESFGDVAFCYCPLLESITIPTSVTSIGEAVFSECTALTDVYYSGAEDTKNNIVIGESNEPLLNATWHYGGCEVLGHNYDSGKVTKAATCAATGVKTYTCSVCRATKPEIIAKSTTHTYSNNCDKSCNICNKTRTVGAHKYSNNCDTSCNVCKATRSISHTYQTITTKATLKTNGKTVKKCTVCGKVASTTTIKYAKTFKLSTTSYSYNGNVKTPSVTVKDYAGNTLKKNTDYTVSYASGRKNVGTYKVTIKMIGKHSGTKTLTFKINPAKTTVSKLTAGKKSITVAITKKSTQVTGYQIQYSTSKSFSKATTKTISSYKTTKYTLKSLRAKKTYYVRVRTYKTVGKTKYYSGWSTYKYKKTK